MIAVQLKVAYHTGTSNSGNQVHSVNLLFVLPIHATNWLILKPYEDPVNRRTDRGKYVMVFGSLSTAVDRADTRSTGRLVHYCRT